MIIILSELIKLINDLELDEDIKKEEIDFKDENNSDENNADNELLDDLIDNSNLNSI